MTTPEKKCCIYCNGANSSLGPVSTVCREEECPCHQKHTSQEEGCICSGRVTLPIQHLKACAFYKKGERGCCSYCWNNPAALKGKFKEEHGCGVPCDCHWPEISHPNHSPEEYGQPDTKGDTIGVLKKLSAAMSHSPEERKYVPFNGEGRIPEEGQLEPSHSPESWEEEFDREFKPFATGNYAANMGDSLKSFIQATRELAKKEERGRIALKEGEKIDCPMSVCCSGCYEAAIEDRLEKTS